jgi:heme-degrading monooxygenase HmoA
MKTPIPFISAAITAAVMPVLTTQSASAQAQIGVFSAPSASVAIVKIPKPWYAPNFFVALKMRDTVALYENLPGLTYKAFTIAQPDQEFGGAYLWKDRVEMEKWFNPAWFERVEKERGHQANVRFFSAPVVVVNQATALDVAYITTLVTIKTPANITREQVLAEFASAALTYQKVPGLIRKYFVLSDDGKFGGVYLWDSKLSAQTWFSPVWSERAAKRFGSEAQLEWFDTPIAITSKLAPNALEQK